MKLLLLNLIILIILSCDFFVAETEEVDPISPVLMVIASVDFYYQEYADPRAALEADGFNIVVASEELGVAIPHANTGQEVGESGNTLVDLSLDEVNVDDYSALVISGGYGATRYYHEFPGTVDNSRWAPIPGAAERLNTIINAFLDQGKYVMGVCNGTNVLAWSRRDGRSLLDGTTVSSPYLNTPSMTYQDVYYPGGLPMHTFASDNGATVASHNSVGNPDSNSDDVSVNQLVLTVQDNHSAFAGGQILSSLLSDD